MLFFGMIPLRETQTVCVKCLGLLIALDLNLSRFQQVMNNFFVINLMI